MLRYVLRTATIFCFWYLIPTGRNSIVVPFCKQNSLFWDSDFSHLNPGKEINKIWVGDNKDNPRTLHRLYHIWCSCVNWVVRKSVKKTSVWWIGKSNVSCRAKRCIKITGGLEICFDVLYQARLDSSSIKYLSYSWWIIVSSPSLSLSKPRNKCWSFTQLTWNVTNSRRSVTIIAKH